MTTPLPSPHITGPYTLLTRNRAERQTFPYLTPALSHALTRKPRRWRILASNGATVASQDGLFV